VNFGDYDEASHPLLVQKATKFPRGVNVVNGVVIHSDDRSSSRDKFEYSFGFIEHERRRLSGEICKMVKIPRKERQWEKTCAEISAVISTSFAFSDVIQEIPSVELTPCS
jgi:hypothetical protein